MKILSLSPSDAVGHLSVHAIRTPQLNIRKGAMISTEDAASMIEAGISEIISAVADEGDVHEDEACDVLAGLLGGEHIAFSPASTGRVNFTSQCLGLLRYDTEKLKQINLIDEGITLALVQHNQLLAPGDMAATLKIIPLFISRASLEKVASLLAKTQLFAIHPLSSKKARLIQTRFEHQSPAMFDATAAVTQERLAKLGSQLEENKVIEHSLVTDMDQAY